MTAIMREMPTQPDDGRAWFDVFLSTARQLRDETVDQLRDGSLLAFGTAAEWRSTIRAIDRIVRHYQK